MTLTAWLLIVMGATLLTIVASLLIPAPAPDKHPFVTDPWETAVEHEGRHRMDEGPTRRLDDSPLRWPGG